MRVGYFKHWFQAPYSFIDFLKTQGVDAEEIDYSKPGYLENFDVAIVTQNGFNDYVENDELYIRKWVANGGILAFMHQDYQRWAPYFLPEEAGFTQLIHRHVPTVYDYYNYMMPWPVNHGLRLFSEPEKISPDEMICWDVPVNTFGIVTRQKPAEWVRTSALSCFLPSEKCQILGSYQDPAVRDGALIMQIPDGKGLWFMNQILFPETDDPGSERCLEFWKKYVKNLLAHFRRYKAGDLAVPERSQAALPLKKNYKMSIHMHSLDWYGCDCSLGTINALMRYMNMDLCAIAVKDEAPYRGKFNLGDFSDDRVMFFHGQEYHPFNWGDSNDDKGHNTYHILAMGMNDGSYTQKFTRSLYGDEQVAQYLCEAIDYVHACGGVACATHPFCDYWYDYKYDAVDMEPLRTLAGGSIERFWLSGGKVALMNSVDLFGVRRMLDNPAVNFIYTDGVPDREKMVNAVKAGRVIAAAFFEEADITLSGNLPGAELTSEAVKNGVLNISAEISKGNICEVRIFSGADVVWRKSFADRQISLEIPLNDIEPDKFIRVEIQGEKPEYIAASTPFYIKG